MTEVDEITFDGVLTALSLLPHATVRSLAVCLGFQWKDSSPATQRVRRRVSEAEELGLVEQCGVIPTGQRGRPSKFYQLTRSGVLRVLAREAASISAKYGERATITCLDEIDRRKPPEDWGQKRADWALGTKDERGKGWFATCIDGEFVCRDDEARRELREVRAPIKGEEWSSS